jgi:hypothetical protein
VTYPDPNTFALNSQEAIQPNPFYNEQVAGCNNPPPVATAPCLKSQGLPPRQNHVTVSTFPRYSL